MLMNWPDLLNPNRRRATTSVGDHRTEFERDFDRSVFSTPVKRLQDKAQVFPLEPHDAIRTRLTHSLEVSSVARGLLAHRGEASFAVLAQQVSDERLRGRVVERIAHDNRIRVPQVLRPYESHDARGHQMAVTQEPFLETESALSKRPFTHCGVRHLAQARKR